MNLLVGSPIAVCAYDLQAAMGLPQSTTSHHLKSLVTAGLVHRQQRGIWAYYSINRAAMRALGVVVDLDDGLEQPLSLAALRESAGDLSSLVEQGVTDLPDPVVAGAASP
jgi:DNA-binding transcriptional ArsR family regulator